MSLADPETNPDRKTPDVARTEPTSGKEGQVHNLWNPAGHRPGHDLPARCRPGALERYGGLEFRGQALYPESNAGIPAQPEQGVHRQVRRRRTARSGPSPETAPHQPAHCPYQAGPGHHRERAGNAAPQKASSPNSTKEWRRSSTMRPPGAGTPAGDRRNGEEQCPH